MFRLAFQLEHVVVADIPCLSKLDSHRYINIVSVRRRHRRQTIVAIADNPVLTLKHKRQNDNNDSVPVPRVILQAQELVGVRLGRSIARRNSAHQKRHKMFSRVCTMLLAPVSTAFRYRSLYIQTYIAGASHTLPGSASTPSADLHDPERPRR